MIVLTLYKGDRVDINKIHWTLADVGDELRRIYATRQDKTAFIRADAKLAYAQIIELLDLAKGAGVEVLGIIPDDLTRDIGSELIEGLMDIILDVRQRYREVKDWDRADLLRQKLNELGVAVEDRSEGATWRIEK